ncbi:MAG: SusD/RagB family nutrient-binding outer membrane lipoprotein [Chitinophagaceae bacterium]
MKKIFSSYTPIALAATMLLGSCAKKIDDAFVNPNADVKQPVEVLLPNIIANMTISYAAAGTNYGPQNDGLYIGRYVQFWATNTTANQYDRMGGATGASDILGSIWAMHYYGQGQNLNRMVEWATQDQKWDYVGVGYAIRAWSWLTLTDTYGDVILKEAFNTSQLVFHYDEQKDVYAEVRRLCHVALANLNRTDGNVSQANLLKGDQFMNGGDVNKWKKFTYGVLARSFSHLTNKTKGTDYLPDSALYYANLAMKTNAENTVATFSNVGGTGTFSYYAPYRGNIGTLRQSRFIADLMSGSNNAFLGVNDPRAWYIIRENPNGTFKGIRPNKGTDALTTNDQPANFWGGAFSSTTAPANDNTCRYIFKNAPLWPIMTASEMAFIRAEIYFKQGDKTNALAAYKEGIKLNFDQLIADYSTSVPTANVMTATTRDNFLANAAVVPSESALTLSHIMLQKYIALYGWGINETWVDLRRYHYNLDTDGGLQVYRDFAPPSGSDLYPDNNSKVVYRARPRYNSEYLYNVDELRRIGALALDYNTLEQWFSIKP